MKAWGMTLVLPLVLIFEAYPAGPGTENLLWVFWQTEFILPPFDKQESVFQPVSGSWRWQRVHLRQIELGPDFWDRNPWYRILMQKRWWWCCVCREIYRQGRERNGTMCSAVAISPIISPSFGSFCSDKIGNGSPHKQDITHNASLYETLYYCHDCVCGKCKLRLK